MCLFCGSDVCDVCEQHHICKKCGDTFDSLESGYCDDCIQEVTCVNCGEINNPTLFEGDAYCEDCFSETFTYCDDCGEVIYQDDSIILDDEVLCESCAGCYKCERCGDYTKEGFMGYNDYYCRDCFDRLYTCCIECGDTISMDDAFSINCDYYCETCRDENFFYCEGCGDWINYDYHSRDGYCQDCDDHQSPPGRPIIGTRTTRTGSSRCFGIEIETEDGDYDSRPDRWGCVVDGSINGMELVSPIMSGDEGLESIEELYDSVSPSFDDCCGIHVHVNVRDLSNGERLRVLKAFHDSKDQWFSRVDPDRWDNTYCNGDMPEEWDDYDAFMEKVSYHRYFWCNPSAISKHGTIEIRLMEGTDNVKKVVAWVIDLIRFVDSVVEKVMV